MAIPSFLQNKPSSGSSDLNIKGMIALAKRRRYFSISVLSWLTIIALTVVVLVPATQEILKAREALQTAQAQLDEKLALLQGLQGLDAREIQRGNRILGAALPAEKPVLPVLYSIDRLATSAQVSVSNFQVSPGLLGTSSAKLDKTQPTISQISPQIATLPLKMDVSGGFENLSTFFQSLDNVVPFIQINSIEFATVASVANQATTSAEYSAEVALSSLYLKNALTSGPMTQVLPLTQADILLLDRLTIANDQREADSLNQTPIIATSSGNIFGTQ